MGLGKGMLGVDFFNFWCERNRNEYLHSGADVQYVNILIGFNHICVQWIFSYLVFMCTVVTSQTFLPVSLNKQISHFKVTFIACHRHSSSVLFNSKHSRKYCIKTQFYLLNVDSHVGETRRDLILNVKDIFFFAKLGFRSLLVQFIMCVVATVVHCERPVDWDQDERSHVKKICSRKDPQNF